MKAPVGLLSDGTVCVSRWRGFAPTSSMQVSVEGEIRNHRLTDISHNMISGGYEHEVRCKSLQIQHGHRLRPKHVQYRGTTQIACRFIYVLYKGKPLDRPVTGAKRSRLLRTRRFACPAWGRQTAGHALPVFSCPGSLERTSARGTPPHCIWYQYITPPQRYCQVLCGVR